MTSRSEDSSALVRFSRVSKSYDGRTSVVDSLDLDVREGEFLTLLGPSGSGKTTCLMMLAGFEEPSTGEIRIAGQLVNRVPAYKRGIGVVFQNYALFPHMTVAQNLAFPLRQRKMPAPEIADRVAKALDMVRLSSLGERLPRQLSGGQQQRVALARALVFDPRLILLDEPLGALDRRLREHMQIEIKRLHQRIGMTAVYVTHDQSEALTMSHRIAVFNRGRIEQIGAPEEVYERPATSFVAHFVGENNSLPGRLVGRGEGCRIALDCGGEVLAEAVDTLAVGDAVELVIRPERIAIAPAEPTDNRAEATVEDVIYNGDHVLLPCRIGSAPILLKAAAPLLEHRPVTRGERLPIGWSRSAGRAFGRRPTP